MKLYEFQPPKDTKHLSSICAVLFIGSILIMGCTVVFGSMSYKWIFQLIALCLLTTAIFITTRYIMKSYVYRIERQRGEDEDEKPCDDLTVTEIQNKHVITVCRLALSSIEEVTVISGENKQQLDDIKKRVREEHRKSFNYCSDIVTKKQICVLATECGEALAIYLAYDDGLLSYLRR